MRLVMGIEKYRLLFGQMGICLYFCGIFPAWKIQNLGLLPRFIDIGFVLVTYLFLIFFSYKRKEGVLDIFKIPVLFVMFGILVFISLLSVGAQDSINLVWCLFAIATMYVFISIDFNKIVLNHWTVIFSILVLLIYLKDLNLASITNGLVRQTIIEGSQAHSLAAYTSIYALAISAGLSSSSASRTIQALVLVTAALSLSIVVISGVRSPIVGLLFCLFIILNVQLKESKLTLILLIVPAFYLVGVFQNTLISLLESAQLAIYSFFDVGVEVDPAAYSRFLQRYEAVMLFSESPILGNGFKSYWVDFPVLQSFSDLGLFFGVVYTFVFVLYPLVWSFVLIYKGCLGGLVFLPLIYIVSFPKLFLNGQPYDWQHFHYLIPVIVFIAGIRKPFRFNFL